MTKIERLLRHIEASPRGLTLTEMQRFIIQLNHPEWDPDEREVANSWEVSRDGAKPRYTRRHRGYWCTTLYGCGGDHGVLASFCHKVDGRWVVTEPIVGPFTRQTKVARKVPMRILEPHSLTGWITAVVQGRWVQAKVYDEPSTFGINDGRVSKCAIGKTDACDGRKNFFNQIDYNYDRGLDFDHLPRGLLDKIVAELETLPRLFTEDTEP